MKTILNKLYTVTEGHLAYSLEFCSLKETIFHAYLEVIDYLFRVEITMKEV